MTVMLEEKKAAFRTKTGACTIEHDRIVLARTGPRGAVARMLIGSSIRRTLVIYIVLAAVSFVSGLTLVFAEQRMAGGTVFLYGLLLLTGIVRSRGLSAVSEIPIAAIQRIEGHPPRPPLTRGYFVVYYTAEGKQFKRLIMLPGSLSGGGAEYNKALCVFDVAGLLTLKPS
jgi:hypothetical protein